ncbi:hypothetical protein DXT99_20305 [Pontibacter diazotrophicus]|uniref:Uncharacterized protein n=1 Tax=Pontibacter diazotrophicus TaxID=1400979 RepID=A0A3D8L7Q7_9BACT|nr:hypothetical protein DXT99_20305 [Pontibacter diazotrophicus]
MAMHLAGKAALPRQAFPPPSSTPPIAAHLPESFPCAGHPSASLLIALRSILPLPEKWLPHPEQSRRHTRITS